MPTISSCPAEEDFQLQPADLQPVVVKRDGTYVPFSTERMVQAIYKAGLAVQMDDLPYAEEIGYKISAEFNGRYQACITSIMKYPKASFVLGAICAGLFMNAFSSTAEARIGERRDSVERRLFSSGGIMYRDDVVEASRRKGMPYLKYLELMSSSTDVRVYYKTADGRRPSSKELEEKRLLPGWDLHVLYVDGKSAIEVYKRSQAMTDYELNQLLTLQAQGSFWKKVDKKAKAEGEEEPPPSAFGYEMELDNGSIRAKKMGNGLMVFDKRLDVMLATMQDSDQQEKAPLSVSGF